ncbi:MAG TPA: hypothetical protein VFU51_04010 [Gaiellaceae bacterium]|nr:hypothetical protein [Gaiellaceae bacterium]
MSRDVALPIFWVNRNPYNRKRHVDPNCRALTQAREYLDMMLDANAYEGRDEIPTQRKRFVKVRVQSSEELAALEAYTIPCRTCIPGAKDLWKVLPIDFESAD